MPNKWKEIDKWSMEWWLREAKWEEEEEERILIGNPFVLLLFHHPSLSFFFFFASDGKVKNLLYLRLKKIDILVRDVRIEKRVCVCVLAMEWQSLRSWSAQIKGAEAEIGFPKKEAAVCFLFSLLLSKSHFTASYPLLLPSLSTTF